MARRKLTPAEQQNLRYLSVEEVSQALNIPPREVRYIENKALTKLRFYFLARGLSKQDLIEVRDGIASK